jgi:hypothetical protein
MDLEIYGSLGLVNFLNTWIGYVFCLSSFGIYYFSVDLLSINGRVSLTCDEHLTSFEKPRV